MAITNGHDFDATPFASNNDPDDYESSDETLLIFTILICNIKVGAFARISCLRHIFRQGLRDLNVQVVRMTR